MDKNAIKKYAVWARREPIGRVSKKALQYGITADGKADPNADSVDGRLLSNAEKKQRQALIRKVNAQGYEQVIEEVSYTWFNRFVALRFMEVNGYLPSHVRVFTNDAGEFKPQILSEAIRLELDGLDKDKVYELKTANKEEELFKYLLIVQCNALNQILPGMFQRIEDYTELLLPDYLLREGSVIERMVNQQDGIPESDWTDQVQIIGWLYQYYISEKKDQVFAGLKKNIKITKENIPAATQLFTPDWIVRYMVENSLGRLWLEGHPNDALKAEWKYYLEEVRQEEDVQKQLDEIRKEYAALKPEELRCIDPCSGSGHILVYMFDILVKIYEDYGYTAREAVTSIIENNLWGLDIDERAAQLSYFAVMMKARQYDRRFFNKKDENGNLAIPQPHVYAIVESNHLDPDGVDAFVGGTAEVKKNLDSLIKQLYDAKEYGSILQISGVDFHLLYSRLNEMNEIDLFTTTAIRELKPLVDVGYALAQQYDVVVTNPPYMSTNNMEVKLAELVKKNYPDSKSDLFAVFIERCRMLVKKNGYQAMITQHAWMFLSSFEKLRAKLQSVDTVNMVHLGARAFEEIGGEVVQTTSFVFRGSNMEDYTGTYCRLIEPTTQQSKEDSFLAGENRFTAKQSNFSKIPGSPVAYWASENLVRVFKDYPTMENIAYSFQGLITGNNNYFLRFWYEPNFEKIILNLTNEKRNRFNNIWVPYSKGGGFRKWYGNNEYLLRWENQGKTLTRARTENENYYFKEGVTWSFVTSGTFSCRYLYNGSLWDVSGSSVFSTGEESNEYICALMNSKIAQSVFDITNPTINYQVMNIMSLPYVQDDRNRIIREKATECIQLSRNDWDSFEISWDFARHPLVNDASTLQDAFLAWKLECEDRFKSLKSNEEELNRIFIDIYGLQDELTPDVEDKDVSVRKADLQRDIKSLISYAVGCMFGRYSLDIPGLAYAGGTWDASKYTTFIPDKDAIIPVCDDEYFEDDIVSRFLKFIEVVYGRDTLEENLRFIANALGGNGSSREVIRNYFMNEFYKDHCKIYHKRPIYWLFDSGKKNGFKCLIYMHRYQPDTIAHIRTDYVHEQQSRYRTAIADLEKRMNDAFSSERVKLNKQLSALRAQATEIMEYEEKIHHLADQMIKINLDDGVKHNYGIFKDVLSKV